MLLGFMYGNQIKPVDSLFTDDYTITSTGSTTFQINLKYKPETLIYTSSDCSELSYTTNSTNATGGIASVRVANPGVGYDRLPGITSISGNGENGVLIANSVQINKLAAMTVPDDVYGYPSDNTLKPLIIMLLFF